MKIGSLSFAENENTDYNLARFIAGIDRVVVDWN